MASDFVSKRVGIFAKLRSRRSSNAKSAGRVGFLARGQLRREKRRENRSQGVGMGRSWSGSVLSFGVRPVSPVFQSDPLDSVEWSSNPFEAGSEF